MQWQSVCPLFLNQGVYTYVGSVDYNNYGGIHSMAKSTVCVCVLRERQWYALTSTPACSLRHCMLPASYVYHLMSPSSWFARLLLIMTAGCIYTCSNILRDSMLVGS